MRWTHLSLLFKQARSLRKESCNPFNLPPNIVWVKSTPLCRFLRNKAENEPSRGANEIIVSSSHGPWTTYKNLVHEGHLILGDKPQEAAARRLQQLHEELLEHYSPKPSWKKHLQFLQRFTLRNYSEPLIRGVYLYGGVGRGKTMLMDVFFETTPPIRKLRIHFHSFMLNIHSKLHKLKESYAVKLRGKDPLAMVADQLCRDYKLVCLDEVEVTDIADALILHRLFSVLWPKGLVLVATSNSAPEDLYQGGLNRKLFEPFLPLLKSHCDSLSLDGGRDYRDGHEKLKTFFIAGDKAEEKAFQEKAKHFFAKEETQKEQKIEIEVMMGRKLLIPEASEAVAKFDFHEICGDALGAADYLALAENFEVLFISGIPLLGGTLREDVARRFITLIDVLYESKKILFASFESRTVEALFDDSDSTTDEFVSIAKEVVRERVDLSVSAEGGSSGRSTTMIGEVEWSATGVKGASLARIGSHKSFTKKASGRTISRLHEMQTKDYILQNRLGIMVMQLLSGQS